MNQYRNYINGEWLESVSNETVPNINPAKNSDSQEAYVFKQPETLKEEMQSRRAIDYCPVELF